MSGSPDVLLLDDGELDDVQKILEAAEVSYGRVRGAAIPDQTPPPRKLLVTTPRRIDSVPVAEKARANDDIVRIVVVNEDSTTLRARLREVGFDYLVRRPVHAEALRLLLLRCCFTGPERRTEPRVPVGFEVSFRTGILPRRAVLADLSTRGCRILSKWAIEPGKRIAVTVPTSAGVANRLSLRGRVVRMRLDEHLAPEGPYSAAVSFEPLAEEDRNELEWLLGERARGPASLDDERRDEPGDRPAAAGLGSAESPDPEKLREILLDVEVQVEADEDATEMEDDGSGERRRGPRGSYERRVPAFGDRAMRVLVARDLSMGGMRVAPESGLQIGDRLHIAIYGCAEDEPFLVWANVDRDDGENGFLLCFESVQADVAQQLENVVANLPAIESLHHDEAQAMGTVVTEILAG